LENIVKTLFQKQKEKQTNKKFRASPVSTISVVKEREPCSPISSLLQILPKWLIIGITNV
jgi:hypothetical protein